MPIYLFIDGDVRGPFSAEELSVLWKAGEITPAALFWYESMSAWCSVGEFQPAPPSVTISPSKVILSTAPYISNREVQVERQIVAAECVLGVNVFKDLLAGVTDVMGGRSQALQGELKRARLTCLRELQAEAAACDADAVVAVQLNHSEIGGGGKSMLMLVASGTAVKLKVGPPPPPG